MALSPSVRVEVTGARGPSFADIARLTGQIGDMVIPANATDAEVLALLGDQFAQIVAAAPYSVIAEVKAAAAGNVTVSNPGTAVFDGVTVTNGQRVLLPLQTAGAQNGIYIFNGSGSAMTRATDFDQTAEVVTGSYVRVMGGDTMAGAWVLVTTGAITVGTTAQVWNRFDVDALAILKRPTGLANVGFIGGGIGAVARTALDKAREARSVKDRGALGDGATDDYASVAAELAIGGSIRFVGPGTYILSSRLQLTQAGTAIYIDPDVTIKVDGGAWNGTQVPFLNIIDIIADNCAVIGSGETSVIQNDASDANGVGIRQASNTYLANFVLDGDKANVTAISDDTFQSGFSQINWTPSNDNSSNTCIVNVTARNWTQYGFNIYGDRSRGDRYIACVSQDNGKTGDALSVGDGFIFTRGVSEQTLVACLSIGNKGRGFRQSAASQLSGQFAFTVCQALRNGLHGFSFTEESNLGSIAGEGTDGISLNGCISRFNGQSGLVAGTFNDVGFMRNVVWSGGILADNDDFGAQIQSNNHATNCTRRVVIGGGAIVTGNGLGGVAVGEHVLDVDYSTALISANDNDDIGDLSNLFTPTIVGTSAAGSGAYTAQVGRFQRLGGLCTIELVVATSAHTGTGNIRMAGLPFPAALDEPLSVMIVLANGLTVTGQVLASPVAGQTYFEVSASNNGAITSITMDGSLTLRLSGSYRI